jgi:hypothetical protein
VDGALTGIAPIRPLQLCADGGYQLRLGALGVPLITVPDKKEASQVADFSIKKCISIIGTMEVTKEEKAKAYNVFKDLDNRQFS